MGAHICHPRGPQPPSRAHLLSEAAVSALTPFPGRGTAAQWGPTEPGVNALLTAEPAQWGPMSQAKGSRPVLPAFSSTTTTTPRQSGGRRLSTHPALTVSLGGGGRQSWIDSLNSKQGESRDCLRETPVQPSHQQPINLLQSKAAHQETPVRVKPTAAPRLDRRTSNSVSLPVRGKSGLPSCAREATKPDFVYRKLIRQFHTTVSDILLQQLPFTTVSRNRLVVLLPTHPPPCPSGMWQS